MRCGHESPIATGGRIFHCGAQQGHAHAHVQMDEASGGLVFWHDDDPSYWWFHADHTEEQLREGARIAAAANAPQPRGLCIELFHQARGTA